MNVIKVPSVFSVKLPGDEWLNLALVRRLHLDETDPPSVTVTWSDGDDTTYTGAKAIALIEAWSELQTIDKSGEDLGIVAGQILFNGGSRELVAAVKSASDEQIRIELLKLPESQRDRLTEVIQRLGLIQGRDR